MSNHGMQVCPYSTLHTYIQDVVQFGRHTSDMCAPASMWRCVPRPAPTHEDDSEAVDSVLNPYAGLRGARGLHARAACTRVHTHVRQNTLKWPDTQQILLHVCMALGAWQCCRGIYAKDGCIVCWGSSLWLVESCGPSNAQMQGMAAHVWRRVGQSKGRALAP